MIDRKPTGESAAARLYRADLILEVADRRDTVVAATLVAPANPERCQSMVFAFPGGGYNRHYFDLRHDALEGCTQAEWHARRDVAFIAFDPLGGGDSTALEPAACGLEDAVEVFDSLSRNVLSLARAGTLADGLPPLSVAGSFGIGHSLGGMQLIAQQGRYGTYDGVAVLGFSALHTVVPTRHGFIAPHAAGEQDGSTLSEAWSGPFTDEIANLRYAYHWEDVHPDLVRADIDVGFPTRRNGDLPPWITRTFPPFAKICLQKGVVADDAAKIEVPVFVSAGERDVLEDIRQESIAYRSSDDISIHEIKQCAHMHNFSPRRADLWARLQSWFDAHARESGVSASRP